MLCACCTIKSIDPMMSIYYQCQFTINKRPSNPYFWCLPICLCVFLDWYSVIIEGAKLWSMRCLTTTFWARRSICILAWTNILYPYLAFCCCIIMYNWSRPLPTLTVYSIYHAVVLVLLFFDLLKSTATSTEYQIIFPHFESITLNILKPWILNF